MVSKAVEQRSGARTSIPVADHVVRQKTAEQPRYAARPIGQNPPHQASVIVVVMCPS